MDSNDINIGMFDILNESPVVGKVFYGPGIGRKESTLPRDFYDHLASTPLQTHSLNVKIVDSEYEWDLDDTDALVTFSDDVAIGIRTADCVPILLYAEDVNGTAAIHAGWKGTLGGIVDNTLDILEKKGADLSQLKAVFGPSISKEHYEVDPDLAEKFVEAGFADFVSYPRGADGKPHLDLQGVNIERLRRRGVLTDNITPSEFCTFSSRYRNGDYRFPSNRRDKTSDRLLTSIMKLSPATLEAQRRRFTGWSREE